MNLNEIRDRYEGINKRNFRRYSAENLALSGSC